MSLARSLMSLAIVGLAACAGAPPSAPAQPARTPSVVKALPTDAEVAAAPECVRRIADLRLALADLQRTGHSGAMPPLGEAWSKMRDTEGYFVPFDLQKGWSEEIRISVQLSGTADAAALQTLEELGMKTGSSIGTIVYGTIPLHELVCLAELAIVRRIELNNPYRDGLGASRNAAERAGGGGPRLARNHHVAAKP